VGLHGAPGGGALARLFKCGWDAETWGLKGLLFGSFMKGKLGTTVVLEGFSEEALCTKLLTDPISLAILHSSQPSALGTGWVLGEHSVAGDR